MRAPYSSAAPAFSTEMTMQSERLHGTIAMFNAERGFGFIRRPNAMDLFFHVMQCRAHETALVSGADVTFELGMDERSNRPCAAAVALAEAA
jgi:cold shock CspA family protein